MFLWGRTYSTCSFFLGIVVKSFSFGPSWVGIAVSDLRDTGTDGSPFSCRDTHRLGFFSSSEVDFFYLTQTPTFPTLASRQAKNDKISKVKCANSKHLKIWIAISKSVVMLHTEVY